MDQNKWKICCKRPLGLRSDFSVRVNCNSVSCVVLLQFHHPFLADVLFIQCPDCEIKIWNRRINGDGKMRYIMFVCRENVWEHPHRAHQGCLSTLCLLISPFGYQWNSSLRTLIAINIY